MGPEVRSRLSIALVHVGAFGALCVLIGAYLDLFAVASAGYFPAWTDELVYVLEARSFAETGGLHGSFFYDGKAAVLFDAGTHGPMYGVVHGLVLAVFGQGSKTLLYEGFAILLFVVVAVSRLRLEPVDRALLVLGLLLHPVTPIYAMTYMQEILQLALTVPMAILLHRASVAPTRSKVIAYLSVVAFAALFRPTYLAWTVGLVPLARSRRELFGALGVAGLAMVSAAGLFRFLYAPYPYGFLVTAGKEPDLLRALAEHASKNVEMFLTSEAVSAPFYLWTKYLFLALLVVFAAAGILKRRRLLIAIALIAATNLALLITVYDAFDWREHRFLAATFHLMLAALALNRMRAALASAVVAMACLFPGALDTSRTFALQHVEASRNVSKDLERDIDLIRDHARGRGPVTILLDPRYFADHRPELPLLPVVNADGQPIRYTVAVGGGPVACDFRLSMDRQTAAVLQTKRQSLAPCR